MQKFLQTYFCIFFFFASFSLWFGGSGIFLQWQGGFIGMKVRGRRLIASGQMLMHVFLRRLKVSKAKVKRQFLSKPLRLLIVYVLPTFLSTSPSCSKMLLLVPKSYAPNSIFWKFTILLMQNISQKIIKFWGIVTNLAYQFLNELRDQFKNFEV